MDIGKAIGFGLLSLLWIWLCATLIISGGGPTFKNLFLIIASGIIIFVPLYKKYFRGNQK
ncbi:MAG: hypothetical protein J1E16_07375 [Muribaculaceae bacterium]|nr:hypothetical protein [Muribaculaceae bacterium]